MGDLVELPVWLDRRTYRVLAVAEAAPGVLRRSGYTVLHHAADVIVPAARLRPAADAAWSP